MSLLRVVRIRYPRKVGVSEMRDVNHGFVICLFARFDFISSHIDRHVPTRHLAYRIFRSKPLNHAQRKRRLKRTTPPTQVDPTVGNVICLIDSSYIIIIRSIIQTPAINYTPNIQKKREDHGRGKRQGCVYI